MTPNPPRRTPHQVSSNKTPLCTRLPGQICSVVSTWPTAISRAPSSSWSAWGDSQALMRAAHSLKGGVGSFAAKPTYDAPLRLEMMGRSGDLSQARGAYATLEAALSRLISLLARLGRGSEGRMTTA
jgi:hypothetical protein